MAKVQLLPTESPTAQGPVSITHTVTLGQGTNPESPTGSQMWIVTGCGYATAAEGLKADVTIACAGSPSATGMLQVFDNVANVHLAWPPLFLQTSFPQDSDVTVTITGQPGTDWSQNDWVQIAVVEMDHTGLGGGM